MSAVTTTFPAQTNSWESIPFDKGGFTKSLYFPEENGHFWKEHLTNLNKHSQPVIARDIQGSVGQIRAEFSFPLFDYSLSTLVTEISLSSDSRHIVAKLAVDESVIAVCEWIGEPVAGGERFRLEEAAMRLEGKMDQARSHFVTATLRALFGLSGSMRLRIPDFQLDITAPSEVAPKTVSEDLQRRQTAYRLMVIEQAFGQQLIWPEFLPDSEREKIAFVYQAITDRSFVWPLDEFPLQVAPNDDARKTLTELDGTQLLVVELECLQGEVLGKQLNLGKTQIIVEDPALVVPEEFQKELIRSNGRKFQTRVKSLTGRGRYQFLEAPRLPVNAWDERVAELIGLEDKLDEQFFQSGNRLAAASISGLTEQEKITITEPFTLSEAAFADPDIEVEK